jgi:misacylated tRNA(Ala) deacylase
MEADMTELLCHQDSYLQAFSARVIEVDADERCVALDRTAFYPGGGGQPHDIGELVVHANILPVTKVKRQGPHIWHWIDGDLPSVGATVTAQLDWERRYQLMRTHTALHILCGVVWRDYGAQVTGGNMDPLKGRMDFEFETLQQELVQEIEAKINTEVQQDRAIRVRDLPRAEAFQIPDLIRTKINLLPEGIEVVRTVEIVGLDLQADGGTHVANTGEVGRVRVVDYKSKGRINKRLHIELEN